jgi:PAS domain S-box-containing protein
MHNSISRSVSVAPFLDTRTLQWLADALPQKVWLADAHGHPYYFNKQWYDYTGLTADELQDGTWVQVLHPEDVASHYIAWQRALMTGMDAMSEVRLRDKEGMYRWHSLCGLAQRNAAGKILLWISVCSDIDEQKRTEQTLRVSEKNVRLRDDFISMASHELKTPLAVLKLQTQLLQKRLAKQGSHDFVAALVRLEAHIQKLERLSQDLLDISKVKAGRLGYVQETFDLDELLSEVAEAMQQLHPTHMILIRGVAKTRLLGDRDRLEQVFTNLLSNAIKYSPAAHTVELEIGSSAEAITVRVRDHGIGIPQEEREKIFERYYRAVDPSTHALPGLGMGLYLVAEIVKEHGGTITVESERGNGSTFQVTLPLTRQPEPAELEHFVVPAT